jgi:hypothetical protein
MWKIVGWSHDGVKTKKIQFEFARITKEQQQRLDDPESE